MQKIIIYHNPRCSKSRQALQLLVAQAIEPQIIEYLKTPLNEKEIKQLLKKLGLKANEIIRKGEPEYKELVQQNPEPTQDDLIRAMAAHPILIERPIVVTHNGAIIARPPEKLLEIL